VFAAGELNLAPFWMKSIEHPSRRACDPSGAKTRGRLIIFETLVAVEQPNKEDGRTDAISEVVTICCRFSSIGLWLTADV
jgi:hypothetical protein